MPGVTASKWTELSDTRLTTQRAKNLARLWDTGERNMKEVGRVRDKFLEVEFWLACIDPIV
jgi:hypothetical protein